MQPTTNDVDDTWIQFKKLHQDAIIPTRATPYSAGFDLYALEDTHIDPLNGNTLVPTGIAVQLPENTYGRIAMRSGLAVKQHLTVSAGVIDVDYNGPIGVVVGCTKLVDVYIFNGAHNVEYVYNRIGYIIKKGERFAQLVVEKICMANAIEVKEIKPRYGRHEGFGSTGK